MKLVELLARELKKWPAGAKFYCQDYNRNAYPYEVKPERHDHRDVLWGCKGQLSGVSAAVLSDIASDNATAIVTRTDWAAERARIAKPAKREDKDGWIRHRGGKCPVEAGVKVDYRMRNGSIDDFGRKSETLDWAHYSEIGDIMAYKLHKPAEHVEPFIEAVHAFNALSKVPQLDGPTVWRDRIAEIDTTTQALTTERAELVQKLVSGGFALIRRINDLLAEAAQKHEAQQPDPGKWEVGDSIECISSDYNFITVGTVYVITGFYRNMVKFLDDDGIEMEYERANFKFHSRPSA